MTGNQRKAITYHAHIKGHHASRQNIMVLEVMATLGQPMPIRMIHWYELIPNQRQLDLFTAQKLSA